MSRVFTSLLMFVFLLGCGEYFPEEPECSSGNFFVDVTKVIGADCGNPAGQIVSVAVGGRGIVQYQLDEGNFQESGVFSGVRPGIHIVNVMDEKGCTASRAVTVPSEISFSQSIKPIIEKSCAIPNCHDGSGAITYLVFENIKANPGDIKARTQSGNMPKDGPLTQDEIEKIACWVDDGALNN